MSLNTIEGTVLIEKDLHVVWAFLSESANLIKWRNNVASANSGRLALNAFQEYTIRAGFLDMPVKEEVVEYTPEHSMSWRISTSQYKGRMPKSSTITRFQLEPSWQGTKLTLRRESHFSLLSPFLALMPLIFRGLWKRQQKQELDRLKHAIESKSVG